MFQHYDNWKKKQQKKQQKTNPEPLSTRYTSLQMDTRSFSRHSPPCLLSATALMGNVVRGASPAPRCALLQRSWTVESSGALC